MDYRRTLGVAVTCALAFGCGGDQFSASSSGADSGALSDGATSDARGGNDGGVGGGDGGSGGDSGGSVDAGRDSSVIDGGGSACAPCPPGFDCIAGACVDSAALHFSMANNPSGNWSYGSSLTFGGAFTKYALNGTVQGSLQYWYLTPGPPPGGLSPSVFYNAASGGPTVYLSSFTMEQGTIGFAPGANGVRSIIRFAAPASRNYSIDARFVGLSGANGAPLTTVDISVFIKGSVLSGQTINTNGGGNSVPFAQQHVQLAMGDVVDFVVGRGNDGSETNDETGLRAIIVAE
jgi:hypothetical protein